MPHQPTLLLNYVKLLDLSILVYWCSFSKNETGHISGGRGRYTGIPTREAKVVCARKQAWLNTMHSVAAFNQLAIFLLPRQNINVIFKKEF